MDFWATTKVFVLSLLLFSCSENTPSEGVSSIPDWQLGLDFANDYRNLSDSSSSFSSKLDWLESCEMVSPAFLSSYEQLMEQDIDFDPVFNAQDYPDEGFSIAHKDSINNRLLLQGIDWPAFKLEIQLIQTESGWKIDQAGVVND